MDSSSIAQPKTPLIVPRPARPWALTLIMVLGALLAGALLLLLLAPALAEAQQTICTRIGNMVTCDTPAYPTGQPSGGASGVPDTVVTPLFRAHPKATRPQKSTATIALLTRQTQTPRRRSDP